MKLSFTMPGHLPSRANERLNRWAAARLTMSQRQRAYVWTLHAFCAAKPKPKLPVTITLMRISPRLLDSDNIEGAFKHIRDGIADAFGVDDSPRSPVTWRYGQRKGSPARAEISIDSE